MHGVTMAAALCFGLATAQPRAIEPANPDVAEPIGVSDAQVALEVQTQLYQEFPGTSLSVHDGTATLAGTVETDRDLRRAAKIARRVEGVRRVCAVAGS